MSEWLGTGLQNRSHQFESGWNLKKKTSHRLVFFLLYVNLYVRRNFLSVEVFGYLQVCISPVVPE